MYEKPGQFRFTLGRLFFATLLASASVGRFTLSLPDIDGFNGVLAGVAFGGAAIGSLFDNALVGALLTLLALLAFAATVSI
jgi:hypothetical protein